MIDGDKNDAILRLTKYSIIYYVHVFNTVISYVFSVLRYASPSEYKREVSTIYSTQTLKYLDTAYKCLIISVL